MNLTINATTGSSATASRVAVKTAIDDALGLPKDSASMSGPAQFFSSLQALAKSDPAALKKTLTEDAAKLTEAAKSATDPIAKKALSDLADTFTEAAKTGDISKLKPQGGKAHHAGGGKPPPGGGGGGSQVYQPADTNQDGTVSAAEQRAYDAKLAAQQVARGVRTYAAQNEAQAASTQGTALSAVQTT